MKNRSNEIRSNEIRIRRELPVQSVTALRAFWDLEKTVLNEICVSGTVLWSPTNVKIPHLHVHKPKTVVVETVSVIFV